MEKIKWKVRTLDSSGIATVDYTHPTLGKCTTTVTLPLEKGRLACEREILFKLPREHFRRARRKLQATNHIAVMEELMNSSGEFDAHIDDDGQYDFQMTE